MNWHWPSSISSTPHMSPGTTTMGSSDRYSTIQLLLFFLFPCLIIQLIHMSQLTEPHYYGALLHCTPLKYCLHNQQMILAYVQDGNPQQIKAHISRKHLFFFSNNRCTEPLCRPRGNWACAAVLLVLVPCLQHNICKGPMWKHHYVHGQINNTESWAVFLARTHGVEGLSWGNWTCSRNLLKIFIWTSSTDLFLNLTPLL